MKKIERMNAIIYALNENGKLTAKEIAELLEVSVRTIYRDIAGLSQMKIPIITYEGNQGGYEIDHHYFVPSIKLSEEEITILIMLLMLGKEMKLPELYKHFEMLKLKLLNAVEKGGSKKLTRFFDKFWVYINKINPGEYVEHVLEIIIKSLEDEKKVSLSYYTPLKDTLTEREVSPFKFIFEDGGWYLIGYCHLREEKRIFRLDRIKSIKLLEDRCSFPADFVFQGNEITLMQYYYLQIDKRFYELIKHDFFMENHKIISGTDQLEIEVYTDSEASILELALKNPKFIHVQGPERIYDQLKSMIKDLCELYN